MNFVWNIFTPLLFYLTPPKVLFGSPPLSVHFIFFCVHWPRAFSTPLCLVHPLFHSSLSVCLQGVSMTRYTLYGCYSSIFYSLLVYELCYCSFICSSSIYILHNQCPMHPIRTVLLSHVYLILPAILPFLYPDNISICCELIPLNLISLFLGL